MYHERTVERRGYLERVLCAPMYPCAVARMKNVSARDICLCRLLIKRSDNLNFKDILSSQVY